MPELKSFAEASQYLARFYENSRVEYTLDRMRDLMTHLDNPQDRLKVVHVAGTSGKTSTAYYVAALLVATGKKTGLTISPHVDQLNERVQINGRPIGERDFCTALSEFLSIVEKSNVQPSWFEVVVAFAYWYFAKRDVDYAVVEVGLGGLKDGTNVISRADKVCIITDIGLDHVGVLGESLSEIAEQKAGIIQPGNAVFSYHQAEEITGVLSKTCAERSASLYIINETTLADSVLPEFQQRNWLLAHEVYKHLQNRDSLQYLTSQVLSKTQQIMVPGRMDISTVAGKTIIMDGAHNAQKMTAFLASFKKLYPGVKPAVLVGVKAGKEYQELVPLLKPFAARIITTNFESSQDLPIQSMDAKELAKAFGQSEIDVMAIPDYRQAYKTLLGSEEDIVVVTGSFYLLGQIRNIT